MANGIPVRVIFTICGPDLKIYMLWEHGESYKLSSVFQGHYASLICLFSVVTGSGSKCMGLYPCSSHQKEQFFLQSHSFKCLDLLPSNPYISAFDYLKLSYS